MAKRAKRKQNALIITFHNKILHETQIALNKYHYLHFSSTLHGDKK